MSLGSYVIRRLAAMTVVLFAVSVITFLIFNVIPNGDPAARMAGKNATPAQIAAIEAEWGFDEPLPAQYTVTMRKLLTGDLDSYFTGLDVLEEIGKGIPRTLSLAVGAALIWMAAGIALGLYGASRAGRGGDRVATVVALAAVSLPAFWIGALASRYLGFELSQALGFELFPNAGYVALAADPLEWVHHLILPWAVLSLGFIGVYSRVVRASVLQTMDEDFVRTARAKGVPERQVMLRHVLRASLIPVVTIWGLDVVAVLGGGAILVETVFDLHGVGQYAANAVATLDLPPLLAITMLGAFLVVIVNALIDIAYAYLDPRVRTDARASA